MRDSKAGTFRHQESCRLRPELYVTITGTMIFLNNNLLHRAIHTYKYTKYILTISIVGGSNIIVLLYCTLGVARGGTRWHDKNSVTGAEFSLSATELSPANWDANSLGNQETQRTWRAEIQMRYITIYDTIPNNTRYCMFVCNHLSDRATPPAVHRFRRCLLRFCLYMIELFYTHAYIWMVYILQPW